jgi:hypothetical protein
MELKLPIRCDARGKLWDGNEKLIGHIFVKEHSDYIVSATNEYAAIKSKARGGAEMVEQRLR